MIRGGYGIFYTNSQTFLNNFVINRRQPPFAETQAITSSTATPQINIADPFIERERRACDQYSKHQSEFP